MQQWRIPVCGRRCQQWQDTPSMHNTHTHRFRDEISSLRKEEKHLQALVVEKISIIVHMRNKLVQRWKELARQQKTHNQKGINPFEIETDIPKWQPTIQQCEKILRKWPVLQPLWRRWARQHAMSQWTQVPTKDVAEYMRVMDQWWIWEMGCVVALPATMSNPTSNTYTPAHTTHKRDIRCSKCRQLVHTMLRTTEATLVLQCPVQEADNFTDFQYNTPNVTSFGGWRAVRSYAMHHATMKCVWVPTT